MAAFTFAASSGVTSVTPCSLAACAATSSMRRASVSASAVKAEPYYGVIRGPDYGAVTIFRPEIRSVGHENPSGRATVYCIVKRRFWRSYS